MKRFIALLLTLTFIFSLVSTCIPTSHAAGLMTLQDLQAKFPHGKYWNHAGNPGSSNSVNNQNGYTSTPCSQHGVVGTSKQTCNGFQPGSTQLSWQCMGFAEKLGYDFTGYNPRNNANGWSTTTSASALDSLKAGDIVRYKNNGHSIFVTAVSGDTVTYADCNSDGHCIIKWGKTISKATLRSTFTHVRRAPYAISSSTSCNCSASYAGDYKCTTSSASLNIRSGHGTGYSVVGSIPSGATVKVTKASGTSSSDWAHIEYNGISGFVTMQYLTKVTSQNYHIKIHHWMSSSKMGDSAGSFVQGSHYYLCYRLYDDVSGKNMNEILDDSYSVRMTFTYPDGTKGTDYTYNNSDSNWIGMTFDKAGTYSYKIVLSGDWTGTFTGTFTVSANPPTLSSSASNVSLTLGSVTSKVANISVGGYYPNSYYLNFAKSNDNVTCSWGDWSGNTVPLTIKAVSAGTTTVTISMKDSATNAVITKITLNVTVNSNDYTVSFNANGGSGVPSSVTKTKGTSFTIPTTVPTRFGYTFLGWSTSSSAASATYRPGDTYSANTSATLYAVWSSSETISANNATSTLSVSIPFAGGCKYFKFTPSSTCVYTFESTGDKDTKIAVYTSGGTEVASNDDGGVNRNFKLETQLTASTTYYVKAYFYGSGTGTYSFTAKKPTYTVSYNANGGTGAPSSQTKSHGVALTLSSAVPTRSGYTFLGWSTSQSATTAEYAKGASFTRDANTTLYAVWKTNAYTITFNANGGTGVPSAITATASCTIPATVPTRFGYTFLGWSTSSSATSATYRPNNTYSANVSATLYAVWASAVTISDTNAVTIPFAGGCNYFKITPSTTCVYTFESTGDKDTKITVYTSGGTEVASNDDGGENRNFKLETQLTAGTTYYVKVYFYGSGTGTYSFTAKKPTYTVSYNANGGTGAPSSQTKSHGTVLTLSSAVPTRSGYTFLGWSTSQSATTAEYAKGASFTRDANTTLYAVWRADAVTLTKIEIASLPTKTVYLVGENLNTQGLVIKATYSNGTVKQLESGFSVNGFSSTAAGTKTVTVTLEGKSVTFSVTVNPTPTVPDVPETDGAAIRISTVTASAGETVTVDVIIENNPGINAFTLGIEYDEEYMTLTGVQANSALGGTFTYSRKAVWGTSSNSTYNGVIMTLTFKVNDTAANGRANVTVTYEEGDICNYEERDINFEIIPGSVTVEGHLAGDINGDGAVNSKDLTRLSKHLSGADDSVVESALDVNGDGRCNTKDWTRLAKYLSGEDVDIY